MDKALTQIHTNLESIKKLTNDADQMEFWSARDLMPLLGYSTVKKLIEVGELIKITEHQNGDYVVYQDLENYPDSLTHVGVLDGEHVFEMGMGSPYKTQSLGCSEGIRRDCILS